MAELHLGARSIQVPEQADADIQEAFFRLLSKGRRFMYTQEGNSQKGTGTLTVWVHPALDWSILFQSAQVPPINEEVVDYLVETTGKNGKLFIPASGS